MRFQAAARERGANPLATSVVLLVRNPDQPVAKNPMTDDLGIVKIDGIKFTAFVNDGEFGVCRRNWPLSGCD